MCRSAFAVAVFLAACVFAPIDACVAQDELFVSNSNCNAITVYARTASGNTPPIRVLTGAATGLSSPSGIAVDLVNDELYVANLTSQSVTVYPRMASGNTAPLRTVAGALTTLEGPRAISVDPVHGEFSVVNRAGFSVTTWARTATGNVAPLRAVRTPMGLSNPFGGLIDLVHDEIAVANNGNFISVFPRLNDGMTPSRLFFRLEHGLQRRPLRHRVGRARRRVRRHDAELPGAGAIGDPVVSTAARWQRIGHPCNRR